MPWIVVMSQPDILLASMIDFAVAGLERSVHTPVARISETGAGWGPMPAGARLNTEACWAQ
jgi:hypothetical protein